MNTKEIMVDWWMARGERWGITGIDFKIELYRDGDLTSKDLDQYDGVEQIALERGEWHLVRVTVTPMGEDLVDHVWARQSADGVEWGDMPSGRIDRDDLMGDLVRDLALEATRSLMRSHVSLKVLKGGAFELAGPGSPF